MGLISFLFGKKDIAEPQIQNQQPPEKLFATVELKSSELIAFDLPAEGVKYQIPNFSPGIYTIPLEAIIKTTEADQSAGDRFVEVDTGVMYFIDADYEDDFRKFEQTLFDEEGDSYNMTEHPENYTENIGIKFDCIIAPGIDSGYDFEGDGIYKLDITKIEKI